MCASVFVSKREGAKEEKLDSGEAWRHSRRNQNNAVDEREGGIDRRNACKQECRQVGT